MCSRTDALECSVRKRRSCRFPAPGVPTTASLGADRVDINRMAPAVDDHTVYPGVPRIISQIAQGEKTQ